MSQPSPADLGGALELGLGGGVSTGLVRDIVSELTALPTVADTFEVTGITETQSVNADGTLTNLVEVTFTVIKPDGSRTGSFHVDVPKASGWRDAAAQAITGYAAELLSLLSL